MLVLKPLDEEGIRTTLARAVESERGLNGAITFGEGAEEALVRLAGGDARKALTLLESAAAAASDRESAAGEAEGGRPDRAGRTVSVEDVETAAAHALVRWDQDQHYDVASAFIKSMRGSDPDAAVHYLARMLEAGEDPRFVARRIMICASEDVGLAAPEILPLTVAAAQAVALVGMPESRIILTEAVLAVAMAPKSNAVVVAINEAQADLRAGKTGPVPAHLRDAHYLGAKALGHGGGYKYSHDEPHGVAAQQYLPDALVGTQYYEPTTRGEEALIGQRLEAIRKILRMH